MERLVGVDREAVVDVGRDYALLRWVCTVNFDKNCWVSGVGKACTEDCMSEVFTEVVIALL